VTSVTFIGTSDAFGAGGRRQAAILLETAAGDGLLLDCAPTTTMGLTALGIERQAIDAILVSHFHADHFAGIPQLVLAATYEDRRRKPLRLVGPPGVETRVRAAAVAMGHSLEERALGFPLRFVELAPGRELDLGVARALAFPVHHQPDSLPHGLRVTAGRRRITYSGDTGWFAGLPEQLGEADLAICECNFLTPTFEYHLDYQTLREHAHELRCGRLVLTHLGETIAGQRGRLELETADDGLVIGL
jgi:ribonuclease BN (tRNA processing enzyme)